ncbi:MAG: hypothetical protein ACFB51_16910 [Anaerolineae bacterium]
MDLSDNPETGLAYFCIMDGKEVGMAQNVIGVEVKHTISDLGYNEFSASLLAMEVVASRHAGRIADAYGAPRITG